MYSVYCTYIHTHTIEKQNDTVTVTLSFQILKCESE